MYQRVVVALDGSPVAEGILPFIEQIAGPLDIEVILLHVVPPAALDSVAMAREVGNGRTGLGRLLFGSVAEAVLRTSPTPVFLKRMTEAALASAA